MQAFDGFWQKVMTPRPVYIGRGFP